MYRFENETAARHESRKRDENNKEKQHVGTYTNRTVRRARRKP